MHAHCVCMHLMALYLCVSECEKYLSMKKEGVAIGRELSKDFQNNFWII